MAQLLDGLEVVMPHPVALLVADMWISLLPGQGGVMVSESPLTGLWWRREMIGGEGC